MKPFSGPLFAVQEACKSDNISNTWVVEEAFCFSYLDYLQQLILIYNELNARISRLFKVIEGISQARSCSSCFYFATTQDNTNQPYGGIIMSKTSTKLYIDAYYNIWNLLKL